MNIDKNAPLQARKEIEIDAPFEKVWAVLTGIDRWPEWQPDVSSATLEGDLAVGSVFRWKAKGMNITSLLQVLEPKRRVGWTGRSLGMNAIHVWVLDPRGEGTRVVTEESLSGWFPRVLKIFDSHFLEKSLMRSLQVLKARVER